MHLEFALSTLELECFAGLTTLRLRLIGYHVEQIQQALGPFWQAFGQKPKLPHGGRLGMLRVQALVLWGLKPMGFQASFGLT